MRDLATSDIRGKPVIDSRGANLGSVADVTIDPASWSVRALVLDVDRAVADDLGIQRPLLGGGGRLELLPAHVRAMGDTVILDVDADQLAGLLRRVD